ncbi:MAG: PD40 domain-containing protein [Bacteroidales bacterium]|nr:PD40 domain-containing protein [Bacteroidales bacterium]
MKRIILFALLAVTGLMAASEARAQESPRWLRKNAISPDGKQVAFSYKGDIYVVGVQGGAARALTTNPAYDSDPVWTPDGKQLYFSSYREGSKDIFCVAAEGGTPKRITDYPGNETPKAVLPDGRIAFTANLQPDVHFDGFPGDPQVWAATGDGSRPQLLTSVTMSELSVRPDGAMLYEDYKGYEDPLRKHHTSSVTRDIWLYKDGTFTQLSQFNGEDRQPVWAADGDTFYYLSEQGGKTINLFRSSVSNPAKSVQLTRYEKDPVRYVSVAQDGTLTYSQNGDLYVLKEGGQPRKLDISVIRDENERDMVKMNFTGGATAMAVSPDGKEIAMVIRGDVFVTSTEYRTTRRITNTPEQERGVSFSKDGRELYYAAERGGCWGIWRTVLTEKNDKLFTYAVKTKEELFSEPGETSFQPVVSPDGKWVAYLRDRTEIVVKPTKGGKVKSLLKGVNYSYSDGDQSFAWSPDSEYLLATDMANGGWNNTDIALIELSTGKVTDLTQSGYTDGGFRWALGGKAMTWESDKNGYRSHGSWGAHDDVYIMFFDGKAMTSFNQDKEDEEIEKLLSGKSEKQLAKEEKKDSLAQEKPKKLELMLEGREYRVQRLTSSSAAYGDHILSKDGRKLYYVSPLESGMGLCVKDLREGSVKVLARGVSGRITPSADGSEIYVFSGRGITKVTLSGGQTKQIGFSGDFEFRPKAEREYMFGHIWKQVKEKFYDPDLHGIDWDYYHDNYAQFLPYIDNYFDFQEMLSEMLGELNGSHTGARYRPAGGESLGRLGVLYDYGYAGDGLRIAEVLPGGVLNLADSKIKAGDLVMAIDGHAVKAGENWFPLLAGKAGKKIVVTVRKDGKDEDLIVKPVANESALLYRRWVRQREEMVERLSGGRIGYVHVQGMDSPSFREVYSKALGKYRTCDALIVDIRHNGGGWLHDDLVTFLGGKAYVEWRPRGQYIGTEPYSKWTKPSCVLMGEDCYSDASGFPYAYRALGLGKLIGMPVPGTMTAVWWETQINPSIVFGIPQVGGWVPAQYYMENHQLEPDIRVANDPASSLRGEDKQLEAAVQEMLRTVNK